MTKLYQPSLKKIHSTNLYKSLEKETDQPTDFENHPAARTVSTNTCPSHARTLIRPRVRCARAVIKMAAFTPFPRIPPAARSHLGLAWRCVRRGRAGAGAGQDCTELAAELVEPLVELP